MAQKHAFQAEVSQLLKLVVHSLYSNPDVFLRELVSNASDALDKLRYRALTEPTLYGDDPALEIRIRPDSASGMLVIEDTGIGMTEAELCENLGTVAHSGTKAFLERAQAAKGSGGGDVSLIGQFGVGFYSAFIVADKVQVVSRAAGATEAFLWTSDANESFTIEPADRTARGTEIRLHLKPEYKKLADEWELRNLVVRYSDYVTYPIKLATEKDGKEELEQVNRAAALWQRPKAEIDDAQYDDLYKHITHDFEGPLARSHFRVEGNLEFAALLYLPKRAPFDLFNPGGKKGLRLYVKRVFILEDCDALVPPYLRFLRGVVDSEDLPLNVSRELLQDSKVLGTIKKQIEKRALDMLDELAKEKPDDYLAFYKTFGPVIKEGLAMGSDAKERVAALTRWKSTHGEELVSLDAYVERMKEDQKAIYYLYGESKQSLAGSPYLEAFVARGIEVLFMTDPVDEWAASGLGEFKGKHLVSAMRADLELESKEEDKKAKETATEDLRPLLERMQRDLADQVREVRVSDRLVDSPGCLVLSKSATPAFMEKLLQDSGRKVSHEKRILEINPTHPLVANLKAHLAKDSPELASWIHIFYEQAVLAEGASLEDPSRFAKSVADLLAKATTLAT